MKYWLSHLPLEVWVDVYRYPWISREKLGRIVDRFRNRRYAEYLQFYLHDWAKRTLQRLCIIPGGLYQMYNGRCFPNFPETPIPENIKSFEYITISQFDAQTITFLRQIGPILSNVNLSLYGYCYTNDMENLRILLANLLPLLNRIHRLCFNARAVPTVEQCFGAELAQIKMLWIFENVLWQMDEGTAQATINFLLNWLTSGQGRTRFCDIVLFNGFLERITPAIRQEFLAAKTQSTFAINLHVYDKDSWQHFVEFHLHTTNGEELHGVKKGAVIIQITRHRANCGIKLQQEWTMAKINEENYGNIMMEHPKIGSLDAIDPPENEDKDQQPSTSKKT